MSGKHRSLLNATIQTFASTRGGAWFGAKALHHFDRAYLKLSGGRRTLTSILAGLPMVMLTTTGAKSGLPRSVPLVCVQDDDNPERFGLIASNWGQDHHPAWYYNLKANPRATGSIEGRLREYTAHEADEAEYAQFWKRATATYLGYNLYKQRVGDRRIPIMVLEPEESR